MKCWKWRWMDLYLVMKRGGSKPEKKTYNQSQKSVSLSDIGGKNSPPQLPTDRTLTCVQILSSSAFKAHPLTLVISSLGQNMPNLTLSNPLNFWLPPMWPNDLLIACSVYTEARGAVDRVSIVCTSKQVQCRHRRLEKFNKTKVSGTHGIEMQTEKPLRNWNPTVHEWHSSITSASLEHWLTHSRVIGTHSHL